MGWGRRDGEWGRAQALPILSYPYCGPSRICPFPDVTLLIRSKAHFFGDLIFGSLENVIFGNLKFEKFVILENKHSDNPTFGEIQTFEKSEFSENLVIIRFSGKSEIFVTI